MFPDVDRINPEYFHYLDRKIDYLNEQGFVPFIEVSRRDVSRCWKKYYEWPDSYARFIQYVWSRYQANNTVLSPIHLDIAQRVRRPADDYLAAIQVVMEKFGPPPFGTLLSANANPSTLRELGRRFLGDAASDRQHAREARQLLVSDGDLPLGPSATRAEWRALLCRLQRCPRQHEASKGQGGYQYGAPGGTEQDDQFVRSAMYGSFLSGGLAGHVYGAEGIWGADIEPAAPVKMWDAFQWSSGRRCSTCARFAFSIGRRYQDLVPDAEMVSPNRTPVLHSHEGWAYCARTPDKEIFLVYFEKGCPVSQVRGRQAPEPLPRAMVRSPHRDLAETPATGRWNPTGSGLITLPDFPSDADWGAALRCLP